MPQDKAKASKQSNAEGLSKMEAVRRALGRLGSDAKPLAMKKYIHDAFGIDMDPNMISSYKSSVNKRLAGQSGLMRRGRHGAGGSFSLQDVQAVKQLTERLGADKVRELAELFG
jgi:hypothetical protein